MRSIWSGASLTPSNVRTCFQNLRSGLLCYKFTVVSLGLLIISIFAIAKLGRIETRIETFLPGYKPGRPISEIENPAVRNLIDMSQRFDERGSLTVIFESKRPLDDVNAVAELREIQEKIAKLPKVKYVLSVLNYPGSDSYIDDNRIDFSNVPEQARTFVSNDLRYALLLVVLDVETGRETEEDVVREIAKSLKGERLYFISEASVNNALFDELRRSMYFYPAAMFFVITAIFYFQTQSLKATIVSLIIPLVAAMLTYALYFVLGGVLNVLTSMIGSFLLIIGSAYPLHYYNATFRTERVREHISVPIFLSMLTTAIGFTSFVFVKIPAFREFGLYVAIGLMIVFLLTITMGDELLRRAMRKSKTTPKGFGVRFVGKGYAIAVLVICIALVAISPLFVPRIKIGLTNVDYFSKNSYVHKVFRLLEEKFGIKDSIFVVLEKKVGFFLPGDTAIITDLSEKLEGHQFIASVDFPTNVPITLLALSARNHPLLRRYVADGRTIRLVLNLTKEGSERIREVERFVDSVVRESPYNFFIAGPPFIWDEVNSNILNSQVQSLALALSLVFATILVVFRNLKEALALVSPVVFATVLNFLYMGAFGMKLEISTALTSSIIVGLAIDYSIHVGHDYKRTKNPSETIRNVGPAIVGNALGIAGGFLTLLIGGELAIFKRLGALVSVGVLTAASITIVALPYLLSLTLATISGNELKERSVMNHLKQREEPKPDGKKYGETGSRAD